jgi:uncharacterized membrane protein (UPF0127 family)
MFFNRLYFLFAISFLLLFANCKENKKVIKQTEVAFTKEGELAIITATDSTKVTLDIEIADTDFDIQTGLMYRNTMADNQGMLFIFEDETERFFYMKNTKFPLDLVFINAEKEIVSFQKNAKPYDESSLPSNAPAKYVLEVKAGLVDAWGITVGNKINFTE